MAAVTRRTVLGLCLPQTQLASCGGASLTVPEIQETRVPSWVGAVGDWSNAPASTLTTSGAGWAGTSPGGTSNYVAVVTAWGGGVLNSVGVWRAGAFVAGTFLIIFGGGHGDYAGNELYAYGPLESSAPTWSRLLNPTIPAPDDVARVGGYPVSRHTYNSLQYLPDTNQMICVGTAGYYHTGFGFVTVDVFNFNINPRSLNPWTAFETGFVSFGGGGTGGIDVQTDYDPVTKKVWALGKGNVSRLQCFDVRTRTWTSWPKNNPSGPTDSKGCIDSMHNLFVYRDNGGTIRVQNLAAPTSMIYAPIASGAAPALGDSTMVWDQTGGRIVYWDGTGSAVHFLTPGANPGVQGDAWAWSVTRPGGESPAAAESNGTYGRMRMATFPWGRGLLLMSRHDAPISFLRMS